jgi:hypothetical protein
MRKMCGGKEKCTQGFDGEMRPLGRPRRRSKNNIKMGLKEVRRKDMYWIDLADSRC